MELIPNNIPPLFICPIHVAIRNRNDQQQHLALSQKNCQDDESSIWIYLESITGQYYANSTFVPAKKKRLQSFRLPNNFPNTYMILYGGFLK